MTKLVSLIFSLIFFFLTISIALVRSEDGAAAVPVSGTDSETSAQLSPSILLESVVKGDIEGVDR
jgi:hypothetical protein